MKKKSLVLWADDDWMNFSKKDLIHHIVEGGLNAVKPLLGVFHYKKQNCYEGKPRKVRITIQEV